MSHETIFFNLKICESFNTSESKSINKEKVKQLKNYAKLNGISISKFLGKQADAIIA